MTGLLETGLPTLTLFGVTPAELRTDVYFQPSFWSLHADPDPVDGLDLGDFRHGAAVRAIPGRERRDLETPHGYGGPLALSHAALAAGLAAWRERQQRAGRVAEFIRLHPCLNPAALDGCVDHLAHNRPTVLIELGRGSEVRLKEYGETTRQLIRKTRRTLRVRRLAASEWPLFRDLYQEMLERRQAGHRHYFPDDYYRRLLSEDWCHALVAECEGRTVAAACFLSTSSPVVHYHLSGASEAGLAMSAHYRLIDEACTLFETQGRRWLHLGGGRTPDPEDGLWRFKAKFSRRYADFHVAGLIHDPEAYQALGGARDGRFLGYRGG